MALSLLAMAADTEKIYVLKNKLNTSSANRKKMIIE